MTTVPLCPVVEPPQEVNWFVNVNGVQTVNAWLIRLKASAVKLPVYASIVQDHVLIPANGKTCRSAIISNPVLCADTTVQPEVVYFVAKTVAESSS
jgi:hypothetical protein